MKECYEYIKVRQRIHDYRIDYTLLKETFLKYMAQLELITVHFK